MSAGTPATLAANHCSSSLSCGCPLSRVPQPQLPVATGRHVPPDTILCASCDSCGPCSDQLHSVFLGFSQIKQTIFYGIEF